MDASSGGILRLVARTVLLGVLVLSLASLRLALALAPALANDNELHLPILLTELNNRGYLHHGGRAVFLGDAGSWLPFLEQSHVAPVSAVQLLAMPDESMDLVLDHSDGVEFNLVDRVLKVGGVAAVFAALKAALQLPDN
ncbi:uncharacterized protein LOC133893002 [Phragmites australis]|uniref:uncharacterized protein LOC133893002 n=1 Tax=Phragmites australis TaxID=29695 RepID=UPI002D777F71|nr:uncharacterized protein LOC133893002 [Phragmites australis]